MEKEMVMYPKFHDKYKPKAEISCALVPLLSAFPVKSPPKAAKNCFSSHRCWEKRDDEGHAHARVTTWCILLTHSALTSSFLPGSS